jgi:hypothetical protein
MTEYRMSEFLRKGDIIVHPDLQKREHSPVTMFLAKMFLDNFESATFAFDGAVGFILIDDGDIYKSFLSGSLCRESIEELQRSGKEPSSVGRIRFDALGPDRELTYRILVEPIRRRWNQLPTWWREVSKGDIPSLVRAVEDNLQRREPLGQSDTVGLVRQLAVTGDPGAIPVLRKAVRHQRLSLRIEAALALHALGDPEGVAVLIYDYQHCPINETDFHILKALECTHDPRAEAVLAERRAAELKREEEKQSRISNGLCASCGGTLGVLDKLAGRQVHKQCS